ncbi:MAG: hypothetical protein GWO02_16655, partial [Gammaproteobacteria bacterium]|nr:hypothetical protein [Gammaproteobacteria bacterium]
AYLQAYDLLLLLAFATTIGIFVFPLPFALIAMGRPHVLLRLNLVMTALAVSLLVLLVWQAGLVGAGLSAVIGAVS